MRVRESPVSERVVDALSTHAGVDPLEVQPMYEVIDPDALDALFHEPPDGTPATDIVRFRYGGYTVTVRDDGEIRISDAPVSAVPVGE